MGQFVDPRQTPGAEISANRPVDLVHLARHTLGDAYLEREVLQLFLTQSRINLNRLKEARDTKQWRIAAHTIMGSARGIGAWSVAEQAKNVERFGHDVGGERSRKAVAVLESAVDAANAFIRSLFVMH